MESDDVQKASHSLWEKIQEVNEANFGDEVLASSLPVWVAFGAFWSFYCRAMDSLLAEMVLLCEGRARVVWADVDVNLGLSLWFEVMNLPTLLYFVGGEVRGKIVGVSSKEKILPQIESVMNLKTK
ncbi:MAG: thioredoxin family protein [Limisphaerales bacterium]|jgi:thioredoxin 1|nr:thioredoxin domain-containing protein [Verrucomicrobiota bacterium]